MPHGIHGLPQARVNPYAQTSQTSPLRQRPEANPAQPAAAATPTAPTAPAEGLTSAEQRMIDQYFPASPEMTLRLYGPGQAAREVNPHAVGGRLDLRG